MQILEYISLTKDLKQSRFTDFMKGVLLKEKIAGILLRFSVVL